MNGHPYAQTETAFNSREHRKRKIFMERNPDKSTMDKEELKGICHAPLLSQEEEQELGALAFGGCEIARKKLVEANLRLVVHIGKSYVTSRFSLGDAISVGTMGLQKAAKKYDPERGTKFSTYASWWIRDALKKAYWHQKGALIHVPTYHQDVARRLRMGEPVKDREAEHHERAKAAHTGYKDVYALSGTSEPEASSEEVEEVYPPELVVTLKKCLKKLLPKDQFILGARFGLGKFKSPVSLKQIATIEGVTVEAIRQREMRALGRLRAILQESQPN